MRTIEAEFWYRLQRDRWDALKTQGWQFSPITHGPEVVTVAIHREGFAATFGVTRSLPIREVHTKLLCMCEVFAMLAINRE